jgi:hypothetical protein
MNGWGGARKGAGRKKGGRNRETLAAQALWVETLAPFADDPEPKCARDLRPLAAAVLAHMMNSRSAWLRLRAARAVLDCEFFSPIKRDGR